MKCVLAVDDAVSLRSMLCDVLRSAGHRVVEASNGQEALDQLRAHRPDIVITDLTMPVMDGLEFIEAARQEAAGQGLPMLLLTTETAERLKNRARAVGATGWLTKPFDPGTVLRLVEQLT